MQIAGRSSDELVAFVRGRIPSLRSIHVHGSWASGHATSQSDVDLSVLADSPVNPLALFELAGDLTAFLGANVDLVDLRAAPTLLKFKIVTEGVRLWARDWRAEDYELLAIREKHDWDIKLREQRRDILKTGQVLARS